MKTWRAVILACVAVALVAGCAAPPRSADTGFRSGYYTVRANDTLYSIAWRYGVDWQQLAAWNGISSPYTIRPGQRLRMNPPPGGAVAASPPPPARSEPSSAPRSGASQPRSESSAPARPAPAPRPAQPAPSAAASGIRWQWPTDGQVIRPFPDGDTGKRGIGISGTRGQPVRAAASGRVVYSGSGLVGYGQLIIVKHDENFLSAYAHNEKLLVTEGMNVAAGQQIARLGDSGTDRPMLHFEIRYDGRPVDPVRYLPRR
ncbi:peptigoglycan-binding protein LysM [Thioalkalivibrio denitrificans]|uniref:Peptigoglycan-binding protein LysM n=1 Tax=Thioalkalivibrio denitrificans TaxID=108003 RepID=A0A1V3NHH2_9GAMM|nr:peptidoglycan DD-metalloendopeptidase family protein [Thioalkalivibrio denitrificans]OOG24559.1 peptigoglycan-binding protein LysM [Thioalkalivibrio denitrificans]